MRSSRRLPLYRRRKSAPLRRSLRRNRSARATWARSGKDNSYGSGATDGTDSGGLPRKLSVPDFWFDEDACEELAPGEHSIDNSTSSSHDAARNDEDTPTAPSGRRLLRRLGSRSRQPADNTAVAVAVAEGADGRALLDAARARAAARGATAAASGAGSNAGDGKDVVDMISGALAALDSGDIPDVSPMKQAQHQSQLQQPQPNIPDGTDSQDWVSDALSDAFEVDSST